MISKSSPAQTKMLTPLLQKSTAYFINFCIDNYRLTLNKVDVLADYNTQMEQVANVSALLYAFLKKRYKIIGNRNIVEFRKNDLFENSYSDWQLHVYTDTTKSSDTKVSTQEMTFFAVPCTTKAGNYYVFNPFTVGGVRRTAVLAAGTYPNTYEYKVKKDWTTLWSGMPYFQQVGKVRIYMDTNRNLRVDKERTQWGHYGINIHRGGDIRRAVNKWSGACQVVPKNYWAEAIPYFHEGFYNLMLIELATETV